MIAIFFVVPAATEPVTLADGLPPVPKFCTASTAIFGVPVDAFA